MYKLVDSQKYWKKAFWLAILTGAILFVPLMIYENGLFLYYGDFNVQQIPFYQLCHRAIRSGNIFWSWYTDLGANFIGSYSFYTLGSPFFWITLPFPTEWLPYFMGPLLILKMGCASLTCYLFCRRYFKNKNYAVIVALLYAFSGFSLYNVFFNHFHEAMVFFPLLLVAIDEYMETGRRGLVFGAVLICCVVNYYFFVGQVVFVLIYLAIKYATGYWKFCWKRFLGLAVESVLGLLASAVILLPSVLAVQQNNRANRPIEGWSSVVYGWEQRYVHIFTSMFFPPDIPARPNLTPDSNAKWASVAAWLPVFSMSGAIAWMKLKKSHWLKILVGILLLCTIVPILNSAFQMFNSSYYARWLYMLTLVTALATGFALESEEVNWRGAVGWTFGVTVAFIALIGLNPNGTDSETGNTLFGLEEYKERFWIYAAIAIISLVLLSICLRFLRSNPRRFTAMMLCSIIGITVLYGSYVLGLGKATCGYDTKNYIIAHCINVDKKIVLPDSDAQDGTNQDFRVDIFDGMDNTGMFLGLPNLQAFHSIVPGSIMDFYPTFGVPRDVATRPEVSHYPLRSLLSIRWLFDSTDVGNSFGNTDDSSDTKMPGYKYVETQENYQIWENKNFIPIGYTFDKYITEEQLATLEGTNKELVLLKAVVLGENARIKYQDILEPIDDVQNLDYSEEAYNNDCAERRENSSSSLTHDNLGFTSMISLEKESLVFYSVPWEPGWTATINGEPAEIDKVDIGLMALRVPAGDNEIRFNYMTPGLKPGIIITIVTLLFFAAYYYAFEILPKRGRKVEE